MYKGPTDIKVSGALFSRWLCKTACNVMALGEEPIPGGFVRHAFGQKPEHPLYVYLAVRASRQLAVDPRRAELRTLWDDTDGTAIFYTCFFGTHWFASNSDLKRSRELAFVGIGKMPTTDLVREPKVMDFTEDLGHGLSAPTYRLVINW